MRREGEEVRAQALDGQRQLSGALHSVGMKVNVRLCRDAPDFCDGLYRAQFVIGVHHGDEHRFRPQRPARVFRVHRSCAAHRQVGNRHALALERLAGIQHRVMLDLGSDDVLLPARVRGRDAEDPQVVGFRAATGEDNFSGPRADERCYGLSRFLHGRPRPLAEGMNRTGVAVFRGKIRQHGLQHLGSHRGGRIVVQVDGLHGMALAALARLSISGPQKGRQAREWLRVRRLAAGLWLWLGDGRAVFARVGRAVADSGRVVAHHGLPATHGL